MTTSLLGDAFGHHIWATERLIDACAGLTSEQLKSPAPGTYGSVIDTLRHLVEADSWYLSFFGNQYQEGGPVGPAAESEGLEQEQLGNGEEIDTR